MNNYPIYKLGEICETTSGGTPNRKNDAYYGGSIPWVKSGELGKGVIYDTEEKITEQAVKESSAKIFPKGTLLIALYGATIGKLGFLGVPAATNQAVCGIFANEKIDLQFLSYYLFHKRNYLIAQGTGGAQPNISQTILKNLPIPLPPLPTQHLIVSRIESLFAELDKGVEYLRTAQQQLKIYRQAVLKSAFEECGEMRKVWELSSIVTSGSRGWAKYYTDKKGARFVRITDLTRDKINLQNNSIQYISLPENVEGKRSLLQPNDVLVSITADLGSIALVPSNIGEAYINQHIAMIRFKNSKQGKFMAYYLRSDYGQRSLLKNKRGGGKLGLGLDDIRNTDVPFVKEEEATEIVLKIETRLSQAEVAEARITESLQKTEALRQSILKKAFGGELV